MPRLILPRPIEIPIGPSIAYVPLTQGLYALIDAEDAERVGKYAWHAALNSTSGHFYARRRVGNARMPLHDAILGEREGFTADHICSERTLDNRKCNLRHADRNQQVWNRRLPKRNTTGFRGVFHEPDKNLYRVVIGFQGKQFRFGRYRCKIEAARIYDREATRLHGQFARLNFPGG